METAAATRSPFDGVQFENVDKIEFKFIREDMLNAVHAFDRFCVSDGIVTVYGPGYVARIRPHAHHHDVCVLEIMFAGSHGEYAGRNFGTWFNRSTLKPLGETMRRELKRRVG